VLGGSCHCSQPWGACNFAVVSRAAHHATWSVWPHVSAYPALCHWSDLGAGLEASLSDGHAETAQLGLFHMCHSLCHQCHLQPLWHVHSTAPQLCFRPRQQISRSRSMRGHFVHRCLCMVRIACRSGFVHGAYPGLPSLAAAACSVTGQLLWPAVVCCWFQPSEHLESGIFVTAGDYTSTVVWQLPRRVFVCSEAWGVAQHVAALSTGYSGGAAPQV
jgi:hypothetical protein